METFNRIIYYLYIPLTTAILIAVICLLLRLSKTMKALNQTALKAKPISEHLNKVSQSMEKIASAKGSFSFFLAIGAVFVILKETIKYYRSEKSLSKSLGKAVLRHSSQIKGLRI